MPLGHWAIGVVLTNLAYLQLNGQWPLVHLSWSIHLDLTPDLSCMPTRNHSKKVVALLAAFWSWKF